MKYRIFIRSWWIDNPKWPDGLEPQAGPKYYIGVATCEDDAIELAQVWNSIHEAGRYSVKAEWEEV